MSLLMTIRIALKALGRNKMRTMLTMLGMIIGVAAVITMVALGKGAEASIADQIKGAGTNTVTIFPGTVNVGGVQTGAGGNSRLMPADADALRELPIVAYVSEGIQSRQQMIYGNQNWSSTVVGTNLDFLQVKSWPMKAGMFFRRCCLATPIRSARRFASRINHSGSSASWRKRGHRPAARTRTIRCSCRGRP